MKTKSQILLELKNSNCDKTKKNSNGNKNKKNSNGYQTQIVTKIKL